MFYSLLEWSKPIHERSGWELICWFVVLPVTFGIGLLIMLFMIFDPVSADSTWQQWAAVTWGAALSVALFFGLPAAAWHEWQQRKFLVRRVKSRYSDT